MHLQMVAVNLLTEVYCWCELVVIHVLGLN